MASTADIIIGAISERRSALIAEAKAITTTWFDSTSCRRINRFYVPLVRITATPCGTQSVRIYWSRRLPVDGFRGRLTASGRSSEKKVIRVRLIYIAPRRSGAAYPDGLFRHARQDELGDIRRVERQLAPIRQELKALGNLLRAAQAYGKSKPARFAD